MDDLLTVGAIAVLAFMLADVAHEVIGHGVGLVAAGGHSGILTTTRLISDQPSGNLGGRLFDLGGPLGNLVCAGLAWSGLRLGRTGPHLRLLCWLVMAFSLFWAFGYMISSGVLARGDWVALVRGLGPPWAWRSVLVIAGTACYRAAMKLVAAEMRGIADLSREGEAARLRRLALVSYVAGGAIACAGAIFDPRGPMEMLNSGATISFLAALGLLRAPAIFLGRPSPMAAQGRVVARSAGWIGVAAAASIIFVALLGRGVRVSW